MQKIVPLYMELDCQWITFTDNKTYRDEKAKIEGGSNFGGFTITEKEKSSFLEASPKLRFIIFVDTTTLYDSTFTWAALEFKKQKSEINGYIYENLSKKIFYVNFPNLRYLLKENTDESDDF